MVSQKHRKLLLDRLRRFSGHYECHITVDICNSELSGLERTCEALDSKLVSIELDSGCSSKQPMLCKRVSGSPAEVLSKIQYLEHILSQSFRVNRVKIEAAIDNHGIPREDDEHFPPDCYFEHHVKLCLTKDENLDELRKVLLEHNAHLSRNSFKVHLEGEERFATQRVRGLGLYSSMKAFKALESFLLDKKISVSKSIYEFNIFDSNSGLDSGWMDSDAKS